jgi:hypothetical protein
MQIINQLLVGPMMIYAEHGMKDYCSIPATTIRRGLKPLYARIDPRTKLDNSNTGGGKQIQIINS